MTKIPRRRKHPPKKKTRGIATNRNKINRMFITNSIIQSFQPDDKRTVCKT